MVMGKDWSQISLPRNTASLVNNISYGDQNYLARQMAKTLQSEQAEQTLFYRDNSSKSAESFNLRSCTFNISINASSLTSSKIFAFHFFYFIISPPQTLFACFSILEIP